jgi:hypothetical protein
VPRLAALQPAHLRDGGENGYEVIDGQMRTRTPKALASTPPSLRTAVDALAPIPAPVVAAPFPSIKTMAK